MKSNRVLWGGFPAALLLAPAILRADLEHYEPTALMTNITFEGGPALMFAPPPGVPGGTPQTVTPSPATNFPALIRGFVGGDPWGQRARIG